MNFDLTDEQRRWRNLARDFAQGEVRPRAAQLDKEQKFPYDIVAEMTELGLMGMTVPEEYGGSDGEIYHSIFYGRPRGMPAWGGTLPSEAIWRLVTYLKSIEPAKDTVATTAW